MSPKTLNSQLVDEWIRVGGLKGFVDGSLGSHTAAMLAPFTDSPSDSGFLVETEADVEPLKRTSSRTFPDGRPGKRNWLRHDGRKSCRRCNSGTRSRDIKHRRLPGCL